MSSKYKFLIFLLLVTGVCLALTDIRTLIFNLPHHISGYCDTCLEDDDRWFAQRYDASVQPFLATDLNVSEDAFNWWKVRGDLVTADASGLIHNSLTNECGVLHVCQHLQIESRSYAVFKATVDSVLKMFPYSSDTSSSGNCRTCSVVGNSGNLNGASYGLLIDAKDIVIRINKGVTKGYEEDVGRKTTHHVMYPESAVDVDNNTHLVLFPFKIMDLEWITMAPTTGFYGRSYAQIKPTIKANKTLVRVINPTFMKYVHQSWLRNNGKYPSTGFMTVALALHLCCKVHVFGFGADSDGNWSHYWEKLLDPRLKTGIHPGTTEYNIILQLAKTKRLEFYKGH